jgi:hypothetical protein
MEDKVVMEVQVEMDHDSLFVRMILVFSFLLVVIFDLVMVEKVENLEQWVVQEVMVVIVKPIFINMNMFVQRHQMDYQDVPWIHREKRNSGSWLSNGYSGRRRVSFCYISLSFPSLFGYYAYCCSILRFFLML